MGKKEPMQNDCGIFKSLGHLIILLFVFIHSFDRRKHLIFSNIISFGAWPLFETL